MIFCMMDVPRINVIERCFRKPFAWFVLGLLVILWAVWINLFPEGVIVLGGDVLQPINLHERWSELHYDYLGRASLFYGIFYLLDTMGISDTGQLSWYLGIFLLGAYASFYGFVRLIFSKASDAIAMLTALFYATNIYTLYVFTATWGFTHYQIVYVFVPILTGLYVKALMTRGRNQWLLWFLLSVACASTSFGNPAFALSFGIYFALLTCGLFLAKLIRSDRVTVKKLVLIAVGAVLLNIYWILPLVTQVRTGVAEVSASTDIVLADTLRKTSAAFYDTVRLLQTHENELYYPKNFPYPSIAWMQYIVSALAFVPFLLVVLMVYKGVFGEYRRKQWLFFGMFIGMSALVAHVRFPFDGINNILFQLPGLNVLRGWDKLAVYMPFLLSALLVMVLMGGFHNTKNRTLIGGSFFLMMVVLALPFYRGGIQTKMSYILAGSNKKDFQMSDYSALVSIPKSYTDIAPIFAKDTQENKISRLPLSAGSSVGRINLPAWGVNGPSVEHALYSKKYIEPNNAYFAGWIAAEDFEKSQYDPQWIMDWYGLIGVKYVMWHKDAKQESVDAMERTKQYFQANENILPLADNKWFTLYSVDDAYVFPYVYAVSGDMILHPTVSGLSSAIESLHTRMKPLAYTRNSPREVVLSMDAVESIKGAQVVLNEKYDPLWKAEFVSSDGHRTVLTRDEDVRYANAWKSDGVRGAGSIDVYYSPIRLLRIGMMISGVSVLAVLGGLLFVCRRKR
jgi:hypothetical protein